MIELVTLEQAKAACNETLSVHDDKILGLVRGVSELVMDYLKLNEDAYLNSDGALDMDSSTLGYNEVPYRVQVAVLYWVALLYRDPSGVELEKWQPGYLPTPVMNMLYSLRTPTLA